MRSPLDRAAIALGTGGVISGLFPLSTYANNNLVAVNGPAVWAFPVLGAVAIAAGLTGRRARVVLAGLTGREQAPEPAANSLAGKPRDGRG